MLISAVEELKKENLNFHITVVGKKPFFSQSHISANLNELFTFRYKQTYIDLYNSVYQSDFIIINLDPDNVDDIKFRQTRVTGSSQLVYGFLKPALINKNFANFYYFNSSNSLIYENSNLSKVMKYAINMSNKKYKKLKDNLLLLSKEIYLSSLNNVKKTLKQITR